MSEIVVDNLDALQQAQAVHQPGDSIVFTEKRWDRIVLHGWKQARFAAKPGATFAGFEVMPDVEEFVLDSLEVTDCPTVGVQLRRDGELGPSGTILNPHFHHSEWHLVAGTAGGSGVTIKGGYLGDVDRAGCDAKNCPEALRILGGGPWTVIGTGFGPCAPHGPVVRIFPQSEYPRIHSVRFDNPVIVSGVHNQGGIDIEGSSRVPPRWPGPIGIYNPTILTPENAVGFGSSWEGAPLDARPFVANGIFRFQGGDQCARGRFVNCLSVNTRGDCAGVTVGPHHLDDNQQPTEQSVLVNGKADPQYTPLTDILGRQRDMTRPSLGAYEWHLQPEPTPPPKLNRLYEKRAVAVEWESVDFPGGTVKVIVGDQTGKQLTSFLTVNDGSAFTTYPLRFTGTRQYRVASLDGTVVSDPETIELA